MPDACPRCGAQRGPLGSCPECGYEPAHPGVLGAYRQALERIAERPMLLVPFLLPAALLFGAEIVLASSPPSLAGQTTLHLAASILAGLLVATWYMEALALATMAIEGPDGFATWPDPVVHRASLVSAAAFVAPWALVLALIAWSPQGTLGALVLLAVFILLIVAVFVSGRAVGIPVQAGLADARSQRLYADGNRRAREHGGLGLVFLGFLLLALPALALGIVQGLELVALDPRLALGVRGFIRWLLGGWIGVAIAIGLLGHRTEPERTFECPVCGAEAIRQGGRARCACGLEGPYYEAPSQPRDV